jgi:hypothetical protein
VQNGIEQDDNGITVKLQKIQGGIVTQETARFKYIVGADGAHSEWYCIGSDRSDSAEPCDQGTVRKSLNLNFVGETRKESMMYIADVHAEGFQLENKV